MEENTYTVYCHTNKLNGKKYIGITSVPVELRWKNGLGYSTSPRFFNAINKYGWDTFDHEILFSGLTNEEANSKEIALIAEYKTTYDEFGYNLATGGATPAHTDTIRKKIVETWDSDPDRRRRFSDAMKAMHNDPVYADAFYRATHRPCSESKKAKIGAANRGRRHTDAAKLKMSLHNRGGSNPAARAVVCIETGAVYDTARDAAKQTGANAAKICEVCRGTRKRSGGYHWKYLEEVI